MVLSESDRARRAEELFLAAVALDRAERRALLDASTRDEAELRAEVESLLAHHESAARFLTTPAIERELARDPDRAAVPLPERIGEYRILRELGAGGMGVVYLAEQDHPRRTVALKIVRPGLASPRALRRFEHEAQALARLQHPGIAPIYAAGSADHGFGEQPFFAMEFVDGPTLTAHAESRSLGTRDRLALMAQVCDALEHAHRRGVVHRDLKPSNILVDESGAAPQVKVLDFGIARVTDGDVHVTSLRTDIGQVIGTVPYMSPEQAGGDPAAIDQRSDVYALGVIAYELLCGRLPLDVVGKPLHEAVRIVREDDPTPLSRVVPTLRGDVETIFGKALEKDPARRYATAGELAADIRRYLTDRPIVARPASRSYVLSKFARRNKALVGGVAAVIVALAAGLATTLHQSSVAAAERDHARLQGTRADAEARRAQAVARFQREMLSRVKPELDGRDVRLAEVLDAAAAALPGDLAGDAAAEGGVRETLGESYHALGMLQQAEEQFRAAHARLASSLGGEDAETLRALGWLATTLADLGRTSEAVEVSERVVNGLGRALGAEHPETLVAQLTLAQAWFDAGREDDGEALVRENVDARRRVLGADDVRTLNAESVLGQILCARGRLADAEPVLAACVERRRAVQGDEHPNTLVGLAMWASVLQQLDRREEAETLYARLLDNGERVLGADHFEMLAWKHNYANLLEKLGRLDDAERLYREGVEAAVRVLGETHADTLTTRRSWARVLGKLKRLDESRAQHESIVATRTRTDGPEAPPTLLAIQDLARVLAQQSRVEEAIEWMSKCADVARRSDVDPDGMLAGLVESYGMLLWQSRRPAEAERELATALERLRRSLGDEHPRVVALNGRLRDVRAALEAQPDATPAK